MKIEINRRNVTSCRSIANSWNGHEIVLRGIRVGNESCFADSERRLMRIEKDESLSFSLLFFIHPTRCHIFVPLTIQKFSNSYVLNIIVFFFSFSVTRSWQRRRLSDVWAQTDREILPSEKYTLIRRLSPNFSFSISHPFHIQLPNLGTSSNGFSLSKPRIDRKYNIISSNSRGKKQQAWKSVTISERVNRENVAMKDRIGIRVTRGPKER